MSELTPRVPRFSGHEPFNAQLRNDWIRAIEQSPDSFDAYLYRPSMPLDETASDERYQEESVTELSTNQDTLSYAPAESVKVLDCPDEQESFFMVDDNGANLGEGMEALLLRVGSNSVPIGSVIEWDEESNEGLRTVWWYVHKALGYGTASVGALYACIPMRDFNQPPAPEVEPEETPEPDDGEDTPLPETPDAPNLDQEVITL